MATTAPVTARLATGLENRGDVRRTEGRGCIEPQEQAEGKYHPRMRLASLWRADRWETRYGEWTFSLGFRTCGPAMWFSPAHAIPHGLWLGARLQTQKEGVRAFG